MEINWYGLSCFRIREAGTTIVCDPYDKSIGSHLNRPRTDIVTISHEQKGHNAIKQVAGDSKVIQGPGEYETHNVFITGLATKHKGKKDEATKERNIAYFFEIGDFTVGHLGDIGEMPKRAQFEDVQVSEVDILMVPIGGSDTFDPTQAVDVVGMLEPKLVIPMHYKQDNMSAKWIGELETVDRFISELGVPAPETQSVLKVSKASLPEETQIVLLSCGG